MCQQKDRPRPAGPAEAISTRNPTPLLDIQDIVALRIGSRSTINKLIQSKELEAFVIGRRRKTTISAVNALIARRQAASGQELEDEAELFRELDAIAQTVPPKSRVHLAARWADRVARSSR